MRFRLITPTGGPPVAPFYIMESKVWNDLFRSVAAVQQQSEKNGPDAPVTFVTAEEAANFARTAFGEMYRLPSPDEWDHAAGLYVVRDRNEVTRPNGRPRVDFCAGPSRLTGRRPARTLTSSISSIWLGTAASSRARFRRNRVKPLASWLPESRRRPPTPSSCAAETSRSPRGLTFQDIRNEHTKYTQRQFAAARSPYTSFRVVVPLP